MHDHHTFLFDLTVTWICAAALLVLLPLFSKKRSWKTFFICLGAGILLPLIVGLLLLFLPFSFFSKKQKVQQGAAEPLPEGSGHPAVLIRKYLGAERHEKTK